MSASTDSAAKTVESEDASYYDTWKGDAAKRLEAMLKQEREAARAIGWTHFGSQQASAFATLAGKELSADLADAARTLHNISAGFLESYNAGVAGASTRKNGTTSVEATAGQTRYTNGLYPASYEAMNKKLDGWLELYKEKLSTETNSTKLLGLRKQVYITESMKQSLLEHQSAAETEVKDTTDVSELENAERVANMFLAHRSKAKR